MRNGWVNCAAEHDSDLASRRREHTAKELERAQDDALILIRAVLAKVAERIKGMDVEELAAVPIGRPISRPGLPTTHDPPQTSVAKIGTEVHRAKQRLGADPRHGAADRQ